MAQTSGIENIWAMHKCDYEGTDHQLSAGHISRKVNDFVGRRNVRKQDTNVRMNMLSTGFDGKWLRYNDLVVAS